MSSARSYPSDNTGGSVSCCRLCFLGVFRVVKIPQGSRERGLGGNHDQRVGGGLDALRNGCKRQADHEERASGHRGCKKQWSHNHCIGGHHGGIRIGGRKGGSGGRQANRGCAYNSGQFLFHNFSCSAANLARDRANLNFIPGQRVRRDSPLTARMVSCLAHGLGLLQDQGAGLLHHLPHVFEAQSALFK